METRARRLARLARLLEQRETVLETRRVVLEGEARAIDDRRRTLLHTIDAGLAAHGLFVDLLAAQIKRLDADADRVARDTAALADALRENARRVHVANRLRADAVREEARERAGRDLADLIDRGAAAGAASFPKG